MPGRTPATPEAAPGREGVEDRRSRARDHREQRQGPDPTDRLSRAREGAGVLAPAECQLAGAGGGGGGGGGGWVEVLVEAAAVV
ncbi:unnamed protein product [Arctogadus glacialis]